MNNSLVAIKEDSPVPKYRQIIDSITDAIDHKQLVRGDKIPSINSLIKQHALSQDTILAAYNRLKARGIISSQVGKGYYVASTKPNHRKKVFVLFDSLTSYKETLYDSFVKTLGNEVSIDIFFHHFNRDVFKHLIEDAIGYYTSYVIMPIAEPGSLAILDRLPKKSVYILDQGRTAVGEKFPSVCQNFQKDLYDGLVAGLHLLGKYDSLNLVIADKRWHFKEIINSFNRFCKEHQFNNNILRSLDEREMSRGEVYIVIDDKDLVQLVKKIEQSRLELGQDCGIISYNDTPLKGGRGQWYHRNFQLISVQWEKKWPR